MTDRQQEVAQKVMNAWVKERRWYRAARNGERVTLVSLQRAGVLSRRIWRGAGTSAPAHEYRPSNDLLCELARSSGASPVADMSPVNIELQELVTQNEGRQARTIAAVKALHCIRCFDVVKNAPKQEPCGCGCHR